jgi:hypothetical protein
MPVFLDAKFVCTQSDDEVVMIGFADEQFNTGEYVLLQRTLKPSEEDKRLGQDSVHIEVNDQRYSGYGSVGSITLSRELVTISLEPATADGARTEIEIQILISKANPDFKELREKTDLLCRNDVQLIDNL